jgi:hypothetical protein
MKPSSQLGTEIETYFEIIMEHIPQVIARTGRSLFLSSEQVLEAAHQKFNIHWERYKVLDLNKPIHGARLLSCVLDFNSLNI